MLRRQICLRITDNTSYKSSVIFEWKLDYVERKYRFFSPATESEALMQLENNHTFLSFCFSGGNGGSMLGDVNISAILDSLSVGYDKRVRPNYGGKS